MKNVLFHICILFLCVHYSHGNATKAAGPYKSAVVRVERCNQTSFPMDLDPPISIVMELYNTSKKSFLMRGNITVSKENRQVKLKMKSFSWQNGHWKLMSTINNIGCHSVLYHSMLMTVGLKYDRETCGYLKGQYYFENVDPDMLQHLWLSETQYGRTLRVSETTRGYSTYTCLEFETLIEPL